MRSQETMTTRLKLIALPFFALCSGMALTAGSANAPRSGADIYRDFCGVCHSGGWQGAPIANDEGEWSARIEAGPEAMFKNVKDGLNAMPPMGTCTDCTDDELKAAISEMLPAAK
jgi:cytochrome c5